MRPSSKEQTADLTQSDQRYLWHPFTQHAEWQESEPLIITAAEGAELIDADGRRYLDGVASLWVGVHGHRHPRVDAAIKDQLDRVAHSTLLGLGNVPATRLAQKLISVAPAPMARGLLQRRRVHRRGDSPEDGVSVAAASWGPQAHAIRPL